MTQILFILKRREDYGQEHYSAGGLSTGLFQSVTFIVDMLKEQIGVDAAMEIAIDNNCIDRLVTEHKPDIVIIEALWVVPEKFDILKKLHPTVKWLVRLHSDVSFLANEGIAMGWIAGYLERGVAVSANSVSAYDNLVKLTGYRLKYLPNYYPLNGKTKKLDKNKDTINIGCFGAIRPLKNQLIQALASIEFSKQIDKKLKFHVNGSRIEMGGNPVIHNLKDLFENTKDAELVQHTWYNYEDFLNLCSDMDLGMQVSFTETFNIVSADIISQGVPNVGSKEIPWSSKKFNAKETDVDSIVQVLHRSWKFPRVNVYLNRLGLQKSNTQTQQAWINYLNKESG